jgi:hypothetical protein
MSSQFGYCLVSISPVRERPSDSSEMVSQLLFGEPVQTISFEQNWCKIITILDQYEGWVDLKHIESLTEEEKNNWLNNCSFQLPKTLTIEGDFGNFISSRGAFISKNEQSFSIGKNTYECLSISDENIPNLIDLAANYLNSPYLWGGKSIFGIDCSGFVQAVFRFFKILLPRDAKDQYLLGESITIQNIKEGDVAFFGNKEGKITHVGILDGKDKIIHASGWVRWDYFDEKGITNIKTGQLTHKLSGIKRFIIEK